MDEWDKVKNKENETILKKFYDDPKKYSFPFQIMILKTMKGLLQRTIENNPQCEIILCERSILSIPIDAFLIFFQERNGIFTL